MGPVLRHRRLAGVLGAVLLGAGCATAPVRPPGAELVAETSRESECQQSAKTAAGTGSWADVANSGMFAALLGALQGALEGAASSSWRGSHAGRDSWIGAAAGAGAGLIAGTVAGVKKVREAQALYAFKYQSCMVEGPSLADPAVLADSESVDEMLPAHPYMGPPAHP